jgi:hypothetical protein
MMPRASSSECRCREQVGHLSTGVGSVGCRLSLSLSMHCVCWVLGDGDGGAKCEE